MQKNIIKVWTCSLVLWSTGIHAMQQAHVESKTKEEQIAQAPGGPSVSVNQSQTIEQLRKQFEDMFKVMNMISAANAIDTAEKEQLIKELQAAQQEVATLQTIKVVKGDIFLVCNLLGYVGYSTRDRIARLVDEQGNSIQFKPQDVLVQIWATSDECSNWGSHQHPTLGDYSFPTSLPLSLLDGKEEGDAISFYFKTKEEEIVKIHLTCKQLPYRYGFSDFQTTLNHHKQSFSAMANASRYDSEKLLEAGVLLLNPHHNPKDHKSSKYLHGPNGFKLNQTAIEKKADS